MRWIAPAIATALLVFAADAQKNAPALARDWAEVPQSSLPARLATVAESLWANVGEARCIVTPIQGTRSRVNHWRIEGHVHDLLERSLAARGAEVVDEAPFVAAVMARLPAKERATGKLPRLRYDNRLIARAAEACGASHVVAGSCTFGSRTTRLLFRIYSADPVKRLTQVSITVPTRDLGLLACVPPTNRKIIEWVEGRIGEKVDSGECWDLANRAFVTFGIQRTGGTTEWGRRLGPRDAILPGDIIQWLPNESGSKHTAVVYDVPQAGTVVTLHQNWASGAERGRKVARGTCSAERLQKARIYRPVPPPGDER